MSNGSWTDRMVGARMAVDQQFASTVADSQFSNPQWSLIMTATEFEIDQPSAPDRARLVANTDALGQIVPELENVGGGMGAVPGAGPQSGGQSGSSGGLLGTVKRVLGLGGGGDDDEPDAETLAAAEELTQTYAEALQDHLEEEGRWVEICEAAAEA